MEASSQERFEQQLAQKEGEIQKREEAVETQRKEIAKAKKASEDQINERVQAERLTIAAEESRKAKTVAALAMSEKVQELAELRQTIDEKNAKVAEAQKLQAEVLRKQRELDDEKRALDLTIETRRQASIAQVREKAKTEVEGVLKLKVAEKEEQIASMQRQIEELKRKSEQVPQQLQGEVLELQLEAILRERFPFDTIEPVGKGEHGGDIIQRVTSPGGQPCGTILWETKRTKNWDDGWLAKLRDDQRRAGAEMAIIVSTALPKTVENFGHVDRIWVTESRCMVPLAIAVRHTLLELTAARQMRQGQATKMEMVYDYLTGPRFRHRIEAIVEKFTDMQADLTREKGDDEQVYGRSERRRLQVYWRLPPVCMVTCKALPVAHCKRLKRSNRSLLKTPSHEYCSPSTVDRDLRHI